MGEGDEQMGSRKRIKEWGGRGRIGRGMDEEEQKEDREGMS